jgi:ubiquinol-cytochrome c reductase cytochrome c subunit
VSGRRLVVVVLPAVVCLALPVLVGVSAAGTQPAPPPGDAGAGSPDGAELYDTACTNCHGDDARGTERGPSLLDEGPAAVDWVLRTGRMPLFAVDHQAVPRDDRRYDRADIDAIIDHLRSLGMRGPDIPEVDVGSGDVGRGGELFRRDCAACHQVLGQGGVVNDGRDAPPLQTVDATTIGEALAIAPGVMPSFAHLDDQEVADVAAYVLRVAQEPDDAGGAGIGHIGPVAEGFVAGLVLAGVVLVVLRWIGTRTRS